MVDRAEEGVWITRVDEGGEQRTASEGKFGRAGGGLLYLEPGVQAPETLRRSSYRVCSYVRWVRAGRLDMRI
jgi:hypothetical protein